MTEKVIAPGKKPFWEYFKKVYAFRSLILTLALRDIKVQYAQTFLGILWSAIQPMTGLLIFYFFFYLVFNVDTGIPFHLFAFSGMVCWYYFTFIIGHAGTSLLGAQDLIKKIYFPKLVLPLSKVFVGFVEFSISFVILVIMMMVAGYYPSIKILLLPVLIILIVITGLSVAIWLSALTIRYRDFHHIIPYIVNFGIWFAPVFYPTTIISDRFHYLIYVNPMAGLIEGFRWMLFDLPAPSPNYLLSLATVFVLFVSGLWYFKNVERKVSDYI